MACVNSGRQLGFSLLEAIVAMVLVSTIGMALFSWINTSLISLNRIQTVSDRESAVRNALGLMRTLNPMQQPAGELRLASLRVEWVAQPVREPRKNAGFPLGEGDYRVGLYLTQVQVYENDRQLVQFELYQIGYQRLQTNELP